MAAQIGLDIGSSAIKVVELSGGKGKYKVEGIGMGVNPVGNLQTQNQAEINQIAEAVRRTVVDAGIKNRKVRAALAESLVYTRVIELPPLSEAELSSALTWEAEQYIPVPLSEVNLDWQILRRPKDSTSGKKMEVFLVAAPKVAVDRMVGILQSAGLEPVELETDVLAIARALVPSEQLPPTLMCHLGAVSTDIAIIEAGKPVFVYTLATAGVALTRAISQNLKLEFARAEQYKRSYGMEEDQLEGKIGQALASVMGAMVTELKKALNFYAARNPAVALKRMVLSGGGAQMPGLTGYLAQQLNVEVIVANPMAGFSWNEEIKQRFEGLESVFAVAVGLALNKGG